MADTTDDVHSASDTSLWLQEAVWKLSLKIPSPIEVVGIKALFRIQVCGSNYLVPFGPAESTWHTSCDYKSPSI